VIDDIVNPPMLISPVQIAEEVASPVLFDWTSIQNAESYQIQVSTNLSNWTVDNGFTTSNNASSSVPVNALTDTVSGFVWTDGASGTFGSITPNTTYYWSVRVFVPGLGASVYSHPRTFTTTSDQNLPQTDFNLNIWETSSVNIHFDDYDDFQVNNRFVNISDYNGTEWRANSQNGYFTEHFSAGLNTDWSILSGTWAVNNSVLIQSDESITNPNIYSDVAQDSGFVYMYNWKMKINQNASNNRAGIFIMCDNPEMTYRGNSYMVYFRLDDNSCQLYKGSETDITLLSDDICTVLPDTWYDYKLLYNTITGLLQAYQNDVIVSEWTDPAPIRNGIAISLRTGSSNVEYDDFIVFKSRTENETYTVGTNGDFRYQNPDINTPAGRIMSVINDFGNNISAITTNYQNIDWSSPDAIGYVSDGLSSDNDTSSSIAVLSANWGQSLDTQSGIDGYYYSVGTSSGNNDIVNWTDGDIINEIVIDNMQLMIDSTYYFSVKAKNSAGLFSVVSFSDGITILDLLSHEYLKNKNDLMAYPNPACKGSSICILEKNGFNEDSEVSLININGEKIMPVITRKNDKYLLLNTELLNTGIYILTIKNSDKQKFIKLIITELN
jgi:hypothetical protein